MKQHNFIHDSDAGGDGIIVATSRKRKLDIIARIICLIFAFFMWIYFVNINDDDVTAEIKVVLDVIGEETLKAETGQMVYGLDTQEITIVVKGTNRDIKKFSASDYRVTVDVSNISGSGKHTIDVKTILPGDSTVKLSVESIQPQNVTIYSDEVFSDEVPLEVLNVGITTPYILGNITKSADKVKITGPRAIVESIDKAQFRISDSNPFHTSTTYTGFKLDFCDVNGEYMPYDDTVITYSTSDIRVEVPIYAKTHVGVSVISGGAPVDAGKYTVTVDPSSISVIGDPTFIQSDAVKSFKIPLALTEDELNGGTVVKIISDSDLLAGLKLDRDALSGGASSVVITVTITKNS